MYDSTFFITVRLPFYSNILSETNQNDVIAGGLDMFKADNEDLVEETITVPLTTEKVKLQEVTIPEE